MSITYVTATAFCVSYTRGYGIDGAKLNVFRVRTRPGKPALFQNAACNGTIFPSIEKAEQYAIEHGFLMPFRSRSWCPVCRKNTSGYKCFDHKVRKAQQSLARTCASE